MRLGLASIYSFRPHVEHLYYLSTLLKQGGHELFFLTCDGGLSNCYARALKGTPRIIECPRCIIGGIRSYPVSNIERISEKCRVALTPIERETLTSSSACTIIRTEADEDLERQDYLSLRESFEAPVEMTYGSTLRWIERNRLDGVICFNGRMEVTRAITYACEKLGVPYITQERTWFSDGLQLIPQGNCLSLREVGRLNREYQNRYLNSLQAHRAAKLIASRFMKSNYNEWRAYNLNSVPMQWPVTTVDGPKVLILPSSRNEFQGHPERESSWPSTRQGFDSVLDELDVDNRNVVLRCHPNWGENIGRSDGALSEEYYTGWSRRRGICCIGSREKADTSDLIRECDILVVNGGSAAFEAGACGKMVICLGPATYEHAGIAVHINHENDLGRLNDLKLHEPLNIVRKTLRYGYTMTRRFPQYVDFVRAQSPTRYRYYEGADQDRIIKQLLTARIEADDAEAAAEGSGEDKLVSLVIGKRWKELAEFVEPGCSRKTLKIGRRSSLRWLDPVRDKLTRGDR